MLEYATKFLIDFFVGPDLLKLELLKLLARKIPDLFAQVYTQWGYYDIYNIMGDWGEVYKPEDYDDESRQLLLDVIERITPDLRSSVDYMCSFPLYLIILVFYDDLVAGKSVGWITIDHIIDFSVGGDGAREFAAQHLYLNSNFFSNLTPRQQAHAWQSLVAASEEIGDKSLTTAFFFVMFINPYFSNDLSDREITRKVIANVNNGDDLGFMMEFIPRETITLSEEFLTYLAQTCFPTLPKRISLTPLFTMPKMELFHRGTKGHQQGLPLTT